MNELDIPHGEIKPLIKLYRLTPTEVAAAAGMSTSNLQKVCKGEASEEARKAVVGAIYSCRQKVLSNFHSRTTA